MELLAADIWSLGITSGTFYIYISALQQNHSQYRNGLWTTTISRCKSNESFRAFLRTPPPTLKMSIVWSGFICGVCACLIKNPKYIGQQIELLGLPFIMNAIKET
jgi:hypothetical protein